MGAMNARVRNRNRTRRKSMLMWLSIWLRKSSSLSLFNNLGNGMCSEGLCFFSMGERYHLLLPLQCNIWAPVLPAFREWGSCYSLRSAKSGQEDLSNNSPVFSRRWCPSFPGWTSWTLVTTSATSSISWIKNSAYHVKI